MRKIWDFIKKRFKRPSRTVRWDKTDRGEGFKYIPFFSKRGIGILILTYFGIMYIVQWMVFLVNELLYNYSRLGYIPIN